MFLISWLKYSKLWQLLIVVPEFEGLSSSSFWLQMKPWGSVPGVQCVVILFQQTTWHTSWCYNLANIFDATPVFCIANQIVIVVIFQVM